MQGGGTMSIYKCNHCKEVIKHNGSYAEIGMFEVVAKVGKIHIPFLYHDECAREICREFIEGANQ